MSNNCLPAPSSTTNSMRLHQAKIQTQKRIYHLSILKFIFLDMFCAIAFRHHQTYFSANSNSPGNTYTRTEVKLYKTIRNKLLYLVKVLWYNRKTSMGIDQFCANRKCLSLKVFSFSQKVRGDWEEKEDLVSPFSLFQPSPSEGHQTQDANNSTPGVTCSKHG